MVYPDGEECDFIAPYNASAVETMKRMLPFGTRRWDAERRVWMIRCDRLADFLDVIDAYYTFFVFDAAMQFGDAPPVQAVPERNPHEQLWATLGLVPGAPVEVVKAAYKALALKWHPDVGGDHNKMSEINRAYAAVIAQCDLTS